MAIRKNAINLGATPNADGYTLAGGTTSRAFTIISGDVTLTGQSAGSNVTIPSSGSSTMVDNVATQTIGGTKTFSTIPLIPTTSPTLPAQAISKAYFDTFVTTGARFVDAADVSTTAALPAGTYANGASGVGATFTVTATGAQSIDGVALTLGMKVLVKNQATQFQNGFYDVTTAGAVGVSLVLTRDTQYDETAEVSVGSFFDIIQGTTNANTQWAMNNNATITLGTTSITFAQFSAPSTVTASLGVKKVGLDFEADLLATGAITLSGNQLQVAVDAARAITIVANALGVAVDSSTIAISGNQLIVKAAGITATQLATGSVNLAGTVVTGILPLANGGTGANLTAPGTDALIGHDNTTGTRKFITLGSGLVYNSASSTLSVTASGFSPIATSTITVNTTVTATNTAYIANAASTIQITIPSTIAVGDEFMVLGNKNASGLWQIKQAASQLIHFGNVNTTIGTGGTITATNQWDTIHLKCVVANLEYVVVSSQGNLDVV